MGLPGGLDGKESACNAGDPGSIPGSGRSPGEGNGYPLQYSYLENSMDRGAWQATFHGVERVGHDIATNILSHTTVKNSGIFIADPVSLYLLGFPGGTNGKESAYNAGDPGLIPESGRSPGEGNDYSLQYSCLGNPMDRGAWWAIVHRITKNQTQLSD